MLTVGFAIVAIDGSYAGYAWLGRSTEDDGMWRFNFAPSAAPQFNTFITISGDTDYNSQRGYGWLDASGPMLAGHWPADKFDTWESRDNLNVVARRGPDDLARSFATGTATFALDLEFGQYEVWVLSGDSGHLEYTPWQPYRIMVEGAEAYRYVMTAQQFHGQFETPVLHDDLTESGVWQRYIKPRFKWSRVQIDLVDGQLNVAVAGTERDRSKISLAGHYPHTEQDRGPAKRYTGAINALVVIPLIKGASSGAEVIAQTDVLRWQSFSNRWPLLPPDKDENQDKEDLNPADYERGYTVYVPHTLESIYPESTLPHQPDTISLRATPGETVPLTVAIRPLMNLGETRIEFSGLHGPAGNDEAVVKTGAETKTEAKLQVDFGVVRYAARAVPEKDGAWRPTPAMIVPANSWVMSKDVSKQFWINLRIPAKLIPGNYRGTITITPTKAARQKLEVELEVLPFALQRPTHIALGMTYFSPVQDAWFDEERFWQRMAAEFADMRAQGFTTVQYTGIGIHDHKRLDRVFRLYREAGFEQPLTLLESYGAIDRLRRDGFAWDTEAFFSRYQQSIQQLLAEATQRHWPPMVVNFGDEFTNSAQEEFGVKVAKSLKQIPGIVTSADANGYKEVKLLAPEVDILSVSNGWAGPNGVNGDKKLLNKRTVDLIKKAGATPWLVNVGKDRFSNGFWLWKMVGLGVRGKTEWIYRSYSGMPYNGFDADPMHAQLVYPGPEGTVIPSLDYQRMRMGFDDLAYLYTLEKLLASGKKTRHNKEAVASAEAFLHKLGKQIDDDMNHYRNDETKRWPAERYDDLRNSTIDHILQLRP